MNWTKRLTRRASLLALAVLVTAGVAGCAVGRHEMPEMTDLPEQFKETGLAQLTGRWWLDFDDPALDAVIAEGLAGSPSLAMSWDRLSQAEAMAHKAGATWWPSVNAEGTATRSRVWGDETPESYSNSYSASGSASYEIDLWGRVRSTRHAAVFDLESSREDLRAAALSLSATIGSTWYQIAEAKAQVDVLSGQLEANHQMLEIVTLRFKGGHVGASDVLRQEQLLESSTGNLELAKSRLEVLRNQLAVLVGRVPEDRVDDSGARLVGLPPLPDTGVPSELLQRRPDVRASELDVAAASARLGAAVADRFPRVSVSANVGSSAATTADLFTSWLSNLIGNVTMPLLDGGSRKAEAERQEALADEAFHRYRQTVLAALSEVENALVQESSQEAYLESVNAQLELADVVMERTRDAYRGGQIGYLPVLAAFISQQSLERQQLTAHRELIAYRIDLCRALGGGWSVETLTEASDGSDWSTQ